MSTNLVISNIVLKEDELCIDVAARMEEHLYFYKQRHPEFSYQIVQDIENNKLTIKTLTLQDNAN